MKPITIVYDIDGTLCNVSSLRHLVRNGYKKDFDAFHRESVNCPPIKWVLDGARADADEGYNVIQVTARQEKYRAVTSWWLAENYVPSSALYMRANGDYRPDYVVKREILDRLLKKYDIVQAYDDNPAVVALWDEYNIPCVVVPGWEE